MESTREIKDIIWDADNTIWNWVRYAAKAYPAMCDAIVKDTGLPAETVEKAMKKFYTLCGTLEDAGLVQGLEAQGLFKDVKNYDKERLIEKVRKAYKDMRNRYLRKYEHIGDILKKTHEKGIRNIIVTDAPAFHAKMRIKRSKLHPYISSAHAMKPRKITDLPPDVLEKMKRGAYDVPFPVYETEVEKPNTNLETVLQIMHETREKIDRHFKDHVAIIGDNDKKDMALARKYGCLGIHALWGLPGDEDIQTLKKFAPEAAAARNAPMTMTSQKPGNEENIVRTAKPGELLKILGIR